MAHAAHYSDAYSPRMSSGLSFFARLLPRKASVKPMSYDQYLAHLASVSSRPSYQEAMKSAKPGKPLNVR
jgi:hypothetical protein